MPSLCLLCVAMLIRALSLWVTTIQQDEAEETDKQASKQASKHKPDKEKDSDTDGPGEQKVEEVKKVTKTKGKKKADDMSMSIVNIGANYLLVHLIGYAVMNSPFLLSYIGKNTFLLG